MNASSRDRNEDPRAEREDQRAVAIYRTLWWMFLCVTLLLAIGVIMVYSAIAPTGIAASVLRGKGSPFYVANQHLIWVILSVILAAAVTRFRSHHLEHLGLIAAFFGLALQWAVLLTPLGHEVAGNRNWLRIGPVGLQPSEFLKAAMIFYLALALARREQVLAAGYERPPMPNPREDFKGFAAWVLGITRPGDLFTLSGWLVLAGLFGIVLGHDMGTAMMYAFVLFMMYFIAGLEWKYILGFGVVGALGATIMVAFSANRRDRILKYFDSLLVLPRTHEPSQSDFGLWAFGSGGFWGKGIGGGTTKWPGGLAEAQTDFIFAVIGEELGFVGCLVVLGLFLGLGWCLMRLGRLIGTPFARYLCAGFTVWFCGQGLANMLVVVGLLPVFGVPLPFLSQGGSSVIACMLGIGVIVALALDVPGVRDCFHTPTRLASRVRVLVRKDR